MMNIFLDGLFKSSNDSNKTDNLFSYNYNGTLYTHSDIIKSAALIPKKKYEVSDVKTLLRNVIYKIEEQDLFKIAKIIKDIVSTSENEYLIILKVDDNHYDLVYGHDILLRTLIEERKYINVKFIEHSFFSNLYYTLNRNKIK